MKIIIIARFSLCNILSLGDINQVKINISWPQRSKGYQLSQSGGGECVTSVRHQSAHLQKFAASPCFNIDDSRDVRRIQVWSVRGCSETLWRRADTIRNDPDSAKHKLSPWCAYRVGIVIFLCSSTKYIKLLRHFILYLLRSRRPPSQITKQMRELYAPVSRRPGYFPDTGLIADRLRSSRASIEPVISRYCSGTSQWRGTATAYCLNYIR